jgi:hypothetical protein
VELLTGADGRAFRPLVLTVRLRLFQTPPARQQTVRENYFFLVGEAGGFVGSVSREKGAAVAWPTSLPEIHPMAYCPPGAITSRARAFRR